MEPTTRDREPNSSLPLAQQLRFDAGSPALNLLATLGYRGTAAPVERLTSGPRLRDWLAGNGWPDFPVRSADLRPVRELREAGYAVLAAVVDGRRPPASAVGTLAGWTARTRPGPRLVPDGAGLRWERPQPSLDAVLVGLARDLGELAVSGRDRLQACSADGCRMIYADRSRGHRRRWCSMARCGNLAKAARHRERRPEPA